MEKQLYRATYHGAKNSTTQSSLLCRTISSKLLDDSSIEALVSGFSLEPPVAFPSNLSFRRVLICP